MRSGIHHEDHEGALEDHEDEPGCGFVFFVDFVLFVIDSKVVW